LSKVLVRHSPKVNGEIDRVAIAEHYGLAEEFADDEPDELAYSGERTLREEKEARREVAANEGPFDEPSGVVLGGSDDPRPSDYDGD
jgi:hypothetical protein